MTSSRIMIVESEGVIPFECDIDDIILPQKDGFHNSSK